MKNLERYLKALKKHLPKKDRDDIVLELKTLILDEFEETNQTEQDLNDILLRMGDPRMVASNYTNKALLSKEIEPLYLLILKIVSGAVTLGLVVASLVDVVFTTQEFSITAVVLALLFAIPDILMAIISAIGMITIIFYFIDKKVTFPTPAFELSSLPDLEDNPFKINKTVELIKIALSAVFIIIINTVNLEYEFEGLRVFNDLTNVVLIATIVLSIGILCSIINYFAKNNLSLLKGSFLVSELLDSAFLLYLSTIVLFHVEFTLVPNFLNHLLRLIFFVLGLLTLLELRKLKTIKDN